MLMACQQNPGRDRSSDFVFDTAYVLQEWSDWDDLNDQQRLQLSRIYYDLGAYDTCIEVLHEVTLNDANIIKAKVYNAMGNYPVALHYIEKHLPDIDTKEEHLLLAELYLANDQQERAFEAYRKAGQSREMNLKFLTYYLRQGDSLRVNKLLEDIHLTDLMPPIDSLVVLFAFRQENWELLDTLQASGSIDNNYISFALFEFQQQWDSALYYAAQLDTPQIFEKQFDIYQQMGQDYDTRLSALSWVNYDTLNVRPLQWLADYEYNSRRFYTTRRLLNRILSLDSTNQYARNKLELVQQNISYLQQQRQQDTTVNNE